MLLVCYAELKVLQCLEAYHPEEFLYHYPMTEVVGFRKLFKIIIIGGE